MRDDSQASGAEEGHVVRGEDVGRRGSGGGLRLWCAALRRDGTFVSLWSRGACSEEGCNAGLERVAGVFLFEGAGAGRNRTTLRAKNFAEG